MIAWKISRRTSSSVINLSLYGLPLQVLEWTDGAFERRRGPSGPPTSLITSRAGDQLLRSGLSLLVSPPQRRSRGTRAAPEPHAEHKHVPGLGIAPGAELVARHGPRN